MDRSAPGGGGGCPGCGLAIVFRDRDGMYDALGPAWALLGPEPLADVARERLGDVVALHGYGDAFLVRPDGHLAWRGTDAAGLRAWLDGALGERKGVLAR